MYVLPRGVGSCIFYLMLEFDSISLSLHVQKMPSTKRMSSTNLLLHKPCCTVQQIATQNVDMIHYPWVVRSI